MPIINSQTKQFFDKIPNSSFMIEEENLNEIEGCEKEDDEEEVSLKKTLIKTSIVMKKYQNAVITLVNRVKVLEEENSTLKKLLNSK
jgi:cell shape-determining protein MreC